MQIANQMHWQHNAKKGAQEHTVKASCKMGFRFFLNPVLKDFSKSHGCNF